MWFEDEDEADDEAYNYNHPEVEVEFDFEEEKYSQEGQDHLSIYDPEAVDTDMDVVFDVPNDPNIIPANLSYEEIGIITDMTCLIKLYHTAQVTLFTVNW
jgi:hypothetical protein